MNEKIFSFKTLKYVINFLIILFIVFDVAVLYIQNVKKEEKVDIFKYKLVLVTSTNPDFNLNEGDILILKKENHLEENDIVIYKEKEEIIVTRAASQIDNDDYQLENGNIVNINNLEGKYIFKVNNILSFFIQKIIPILFIIMYINIYILIKI